MTWKFRRTSEITTLSLLFLYDNPPSYVWLTLLLSFISIPCHFYHFIRFWIIVKDILLVGEGVDYLLAAFFLRWFRWQNLDLSRMTHPSKEVWGNDEASILLYKLYFSMRMFFKIHPLWKPNTKITNFQNYTKQWLTVAGRIYFNPNHDCQSWVVTFTYIRDCKSQVVEFLWLDLLLKGENTCSAQWIQQRTI